MYFSCGIAALAMVASLTPSNLTVEEIFSEAKSRGYTNNGEMFSVQNMLLLAEEVVSPWYKVEMFSSGLFCNKSYVVSRLFSGDLMLIPYPFLLHLELIRILLFYSHLHVC